MKAETLILRQKAIDLYNELESYQHTAERLGVSRQRIHQLVTGYASPSTKKKRPIEDWWYSKVDWSKSNVQIAKEVNKTPTTVRHMRIKYGHAKEHWWDAVDWSLSDKQIASDFGKNPSYVNFVRRNYSK